jgi:flagellin
MGPNGTQDVNVSSQTAANVRTAINNVASFTGVFASASTYSGSGGTYALTQDFGTAQTVQIEVVAGTASLALRNAALANQTVGGRITDRGKDAKVTFSGVSYTGTGSRFSINSTNVNMSFNLEPGANTVALPGTGASAFTVRRSGLNFQLNETAALTDGLRVGLENMSAGRMGFEKVADVVSRAVSGVATTDKGGYLTSLKRGGDNDLATSPQNALNIVSAAINQVSSLRGYLGAVGQNTIEPNISAINVEMENLSAAYSRFKDLDFAAETANFTRTQILYQAGTAVLASANLIPQTVLTLLR